MQLPENIIDTTYTGTDSSIDDVYFCNQFCKLVYFCNCDTHTPGLVAYSTLDSCHLDYNVTGMKLKTP